MKNEPWRGCSASKVQWLECKLANKRAELARLNLELATRSGGNAGPGGCKTREQRWLRLGVTQLIEALHRAERLTWTNIRLERELEGYKRRSRQGRLEGPEVWAENIELRKRLAEAEAAIRELSSPERPEGDQ